MAGYPTIEQGQIAGERNSSSPSNSYLVTRPEANLTVIGVQTAVAIGLAANDTHLIGLMVTAALTGSCVITGFENSAGAAVSITFPAGTTPGFKDFFGAKNSKGQLTITCSNVADANLVSALWRPV